MSIPLRNPDFGDSFDVWQRRVTNELIDGSLKILRLDDWPKTRLIKFISNGLTEDEAMNYYNYIEQNLGLESPFQDQYGRSWVGIIINPDSNLTDNGRVNYDGDGNPVINDPCVKNFSVDVNLLVIQS